jgi:hypothetical protein
MLAKPNLTLDVDQKFGTLDFFAIRGEELNSVQVSPQSKFGDLTWIFENPVPGKRPSDSTLNWNMTLFGGSRLGDLEHSRRLEWAKKLFLSMLLAPASGRPPAPGAVPLIQLQFKWLLSWMSTEGYELPNELSPVVIRRYVELIPEFMSRYSKIREFGPDYFNTPLMLLVKLWEQRFILEKMGVKSIERHPFEGKSVSGQQPALLT